MPLGVGDYEAVVTDNREGDRVVASLTPYLIRGQWNRFLDEPSDAEVTVGLSAECCDVLCKFTTLRHDLVLLRDGEVVWQGPIVRRRYSRDSQTMRIMARDVVFWLQRRVLRKDYNFTGNLGTYIERIITDAMAPDDRGVIPHLTILPGLIDGTREQAAFTAYAYDELRELARTVMDYTTVGKRLIIGPDLYTLGTLPTLTDEHFNEGIEVMEDGIDFRTFSVTRGNRGILVTSGGADDYFGLVEGIVREFSIRDEESAQAAADIDVGQRDYPPLLLFGEGGAILSPEAPVEVTDLVPGVISIISLSEVCPATAQQQRLLRVEVNFSNDDGENPEGFGTRWGPLGATVNRQG